MIQPIVENVIKHAFIGLEQKGKIELGCEQHDDSIIICVLDNGTGMHQDPFVKESSYGLKNIKKRLNILDQNLKSNSSLHFINERKLASKWATKVEIRIPIIKNEHESITRRG